MKKNYIMTPGPTPISEEVLIEHGKPLMHHRSPEFSEIFTSVTEKLKKFIHTENDVFILTSSGTGSMETAVSNIFSKGDKVLVVNVGNFGERFKKISKEFQLDLNSLDYEWGETAQPDKIKEFLENNPDTKGVMIQMSETSTGALNDIKTVGDVVKDFNAVLIVDAVSGLGATEFEADKWKVDVVCGGSQKALSAPTGISFISVSKKAWNMVEKSDIPRFYFDLRTAKKYLENKPPQTPWTPGISIIVAMDKALDMYFEEGEDKVFERHRIMALAVQKACESLGLKMLVEDPLKRGCSVSSVWVPEGIDGKLLTNTMRVKYGVTIAGGQGKLKGKIFRIGHLGYVGIFDLITAISALEFCLREQGYEFELGKGVQAVMDTFYKNNYLDDK